MRVIIGGSRSLTAYALLEAAIALAQADGLVITEVVCGMAAGVDRLGLVWAQRHAIPVRLFPANWDRDGKAAGPIRNADMAQSADWALLLWDGVSRGTRNMQETMIKLHWPRPCLSLYMVRNGQIARAL